MVITYIFIRPSIQSFEISLHICSTRFMPHTSGGAQSSPWYPTLKKWGAVQAPNLNHPAHQINVEEPEYAMPVVAKMNASWEMGCLNAVRR